MNTVDPRLMANAIRFLSMDAIERACDGHPGTPMGCADIATALFTKHLKYNPKDPKWFDRDRFVQSNGHGSMLIYSLLHLSGYEEISIDQIRNFRELGSHCAGHPERDLKVGIEVTTGPLGQGIANAAGMAVAEAFLNARFGEGIVDHYTYALVGDGCLQEGLGQEIISLAGHLQLGKLIFLWDDNQMTDDGATHQAITDDVRARFRLSGWHVIDCDGQDFASVDAALFLAKKDPRPTMIACRTRIGFGIPRIEDTRAAHGGRVFKEDTEAARKHLNWPHAPFTVPQEIVDAWRTAGRRSEGEYAAWNARVEQLDPAQKAEFKRIVAGDLPEGWLDVLLAYKKRMAAEKPEQPGLVSSGQILNVLSAAIPELISGAPDLEAATKHKNGMAPFTPENRSGRYVHYGIREHAMGSMMNGMVAHGGVIPCGITFLVFSDYERPAQRMAAMMGLPTKFLFTHDSIGIGKNGPTHQPIEMLASLRAIPNMLVLRAADAVEMAECWQIMMESKNRPASLITSRQAIPTLRTEHVAQNLSAQGAYILADAEGGARKATIFSTGSEVSIALKARGMLQAEGIPTAVVSVPSWELFEEQDAAYQARIIGRGTARVAIEAARKLGWERFIGEDGGFVGMHTFGASGPVEDVYNKFGITAEHVAQEVRSRL